MAKNLMNLAKGTKKPTSVAKKPAEKLEVVKTITPAEERDLKAKQAVAELLQDVQLTPEIKEEPVLEIEAAPNMGTEWLEEQVTLLNEQVENLRNELAQSKDDYADLYNSTQNGGVVNEGEVKTKVLELFDELQQNYVNMGKNPMTGAPNFQVLFPAFLNRMILFFPFLGNYKKY